MGARTARSPVSANRDLRTHSEASERVLRDHLKSIFALSELHLGGFDVLAALKRSGEPYKLSPTAFYETLAVSSGGMTNRLERGGLIERHPDPDDRRAKLIRLAEFAKREVDEIIGRQAVDVAPALGPFAPGARNAQRAACKADLRPVKKTTQVSRTFKRPFVAPFASYRGWRRQARRRERCP